MTVSTFELDPVTVALCAWVETQVGVPVEDSVAAPTPPDIYAVLFQLGSPRTAPAPMVGMTLVEVTYQVTCVATVPSLVRTLADRVRAAIAGTDRRGVHTIAMTLTTVTVVRRDSNEDGHLEVVNGVCQWPETFRLTLAPA